MSDQVIPNKTTARAFHAALRAKEASKYEFGKFYRAMLDSGLWDTQTFLAEEFGLSTSHVSRMIALTRIPVEVVIALGGPTQISFRIGDALLNAISVHGEEQIRERAMSAKNRGLRSREDVLAFVLAGRTPGENRRFKIRVARDRKSLRLEIPEIDRLLPHLSLFEEELSRALFFIDVRIQASAEVEARRAEALFRWENGR